MPELSEHGSFEHNKFILDYCNCHDHEEGDDDDNEDGCKR